MMSTGRKRMTFVVTAEIEELMDEAKRIYYDKSQSEMIRILVAAGLNAVKEERVNQAMQNS